MPKGVVTDIVPVLPEASMAVIVLLFTTTNDATAVPPILTAVVPERFEPVMVMLVPTGPTVGVKEVMVEISALVTVVV
jgi:hypothetical protein